MNETSSSDQDARVAGPSREARSSLSSTILGKLFVRRQRWGLTWGGRLLVLGMVAVVGVIAGRNLCSFLSVSNPVAGQFLVVEGWMPIYAYREAASEFRGGGYDKAIAARTLERDGDLATDLEQHSGAEKLLRFGIPPERVVEVSYPQVHRDRTFHAAVAVRKWLQDQGMRSASIDVVTVGPHARRSRLLYQKALGDGFEVGVISLDDRRFDPSHWWRSSEGARSVVEEFLAYLYVRMFFSASD